MIGVIKKAIRVFHIVYFVHLMLHTKASFCVLYRIAEKQIKGKECRQCSSQWGGCLQAAQAHFLARCPSALQEIPQLKDFQLQPFHKIQGAI